MSSRRPGRSPARCAAGSVLLLLVSGCASSSGPVYGPLPAGPTSVPAAKTVAGLSSRSIGALGQVLTDPGGNTVYADLEEIMPGSACDATCRRTWPVLLAPAPSPVTADGSARAGLIGVAALAGRRILTYGGHVLHLYAGDASPGTAQGQNVQGVWAAVTVAGTPALGIP